MGRYILMPKLDMSMEQGEIVNWLVGEGDYIEKGDYIAEIETGKVSIQVDNATTAGTVLKIYYEIGQTVEVNCPIMYVGKQGEFVPSLDESLHYFQTNTDRSAQACATSEQSLHTHDLIVIGGGPGGYTCAIRAAQLGKKVVLIEKNQMGGVCLNKGCIPTKSFIKNAQVLQTVRHAAEMGIEIPSFAANWQKVLKRKNELVVSMRRGLDRVMRQHNIDIVTGTAKIISSGTVTANGQTFSADHIVIATGSKPDKNPWDFPKTSIEIRTSEEVLEMEKLPIHMLVCGADVIGIELAYVFHEFGVNVTIIEPTNRVLPHADHDISKLMERELKQTGIQLRLDCTIKQLEQNTAILSDGSEIETQLIVSTSRRGATIPECYQSIAYNAEGFVSIDEEMQTSVPDIFAIGDCTGKSLMAHTAIRQGTVLADNLFGTHSKIDYRTIPTCLFSYPEAAWIGLTEEEARERKIPIKVSKTKFSSVGKALAAAQPQGLVKVIADSRWDEILGVHIIGANATDIIAQASIAMTAELCSEDIANTVFAHPTFSEAFMNACGGINNQQ